MHIRDELIILRIGNSNRMTVHTLYCAESNVSAKQKQGSCLKEKLHTPSKHALLPAANFYAENGFPWEQYSPPHIYRDGTLKLGHARFPS